MDGLGLFDADQGRLVEAVVATRRALEIQIATIGPCASENAVAQNNLDVLSFRAGDYATAEEGFREALRILGAPSSSPTIWRPLQATEEQSL